MKTLSQLVLVMTLVCLVGCETTNTWGWLQSPRDEERRAEIERQAQQGQMRDIR